MLHPLRQIGITGVLQVARRKFRQEDEKGVVTTYAYRKAGKCFTIEHSQIQRGESKNHKFEDTWGSPVEITNDEYLRMSND